MATSKKTAVKAPAKKAPAKKVAAPAKKAAPVKKAAPAKKAAPVKKSVPAKKAAPAKKVAAPAKKAAPVKKATTPAKAVTNKKAAPAKKAAVAPAKKAVAPKKADVKAKKAVASKKVEVPVKKVVSKKVEQPKKSVEKAKAAPIKKVAEPKIEKVKAVKAEKPVVEKPVKEPKAPKSPKKAKSAPGKRTIIHSKIDSTRAAIPTPAPEGRNLRDEKKTTNVVAHRTINKKAEEPKSYSGQFQPEEKRSILDRQPEENTTVFRYSDEDLNEFKALILERLETAKRDLAYYQGLITRKDESGTEDTENRFGSMEDGSGTMEKEQLVQLASRQIQFVNHLEKALVRIENKTYGICRVTGKLIDKARLRAVPHATLSIEAKTNMNK